METLFVFPVRKTTPDGPQELYGFAQRIREGPRSEDIAVHLEEMKREIEKLVLEKGFYNRPEDVSKKLLFAFIELAEASDAWKKGKGEEKIAEELIDVVFYLLDSSRLACPSINMDEMFRKKLAKNRERPYQYGEGHRTNHNCADLPGKTTIAGKAHKK